VAVAVKVGKNDSENRERTIFYPRVVRWGASPCRRHSSTQSFVHFGNASLIKRHVPPFRDARALPVLQKLVKSFSKFTFLSTIRGKNDSSVPVFA
jgi:hypothetical protein